ncbi:MAG: glycosyltransferase family 2 protein [Bulleidia sp.]
MNISVVIAVYNGEKYLSEQLDSILSQLRSDDELIVSLDPSTDQSEAMIRGYMKDDHRIRLVRGNGKGLIRNFENGLEQVRNEIVFLSDQDDVWMKDKVQKVLSSFDRNTMIVMHDAQITDDELNPKEITFFKERNVQTGIWNNIMKNTYRGCCMAFRKELLDIVLPFPQPLPMHDQLIGLAGETVGEVRLVSEPLILYRRHENNASDMNHSGMIQMIKWRFQIIRAYQQIKHRVKSKRKK